MQNSDHIDVYAGLLTFQNNEAYQTKKTPKYATECFLFSDSPLTGEVSEQKPYAFLNLVPGTHNFGHIQTAALLRIFWYVRKHDPSIRMPDVSSSNSYHGGWANDEIASIASLFLGIRLMASDNVREFDLESFKDFGRPEANRKTPPQSFLNIRSPIVPNAYKTANLQDLSELSNLSNISKTDYVSLVRSARLYQNALWIVEADAATAWLLMVSALETAAQCWKKEFSSIQAFEKIELKLSEKLKGECSHALYEEVAKTFGHKSKAQAKFLDFCEHFFPEPPEIRPPKQYQIEWTRENFAKSLKTIYKYRSKALHNGVPFPQPLCAPAPYVAENNVAIEKGILGIRCNTLGGTWLADDLPFSLNTFSYFTHGCLKKWLQHLMQDPANIQV